MGSTSSAELQHLQCPCAVIQLRNWKDDDKDKLIVVPVTEEAFAHSADHPLFQLLHTARNEPAVRHWYAGNGASGTVDRTSELEPHISAAAYYAEVFPAHSIKSNTRWMMLSAPVLEGASVCGVKDSFLTVDQVCALATASGSGITAAGFIECSHATLATTLRYWMVKTFSTEGRSLVLFQVAAFMEARRMRLANLPTGNPAAVEFVFRAGDTSTLRTLEWSFRKLLPDVLDDQNVTVTVCSDSLLLSVHLSSGAMEKMVSQLESAIVKTTSTLVSLVVDQRPVERIPTPFTSFVEVAKDIWSRENAVVSCAQPNQRQAVSRSDRGRRKEKLEKQAAAAAATALVNHLSESTPVALTTEAVQPLISPPPTPPSPPAPASATPDSILSLIPQLPPKEAASVVLPPSLRSSSTSSPKEEAFHLNLSINNFSICPNTIRRSGRNSSSCDSSSSTTSGPGSSQGPQSQCCTADSMPPSPQQARPARRRTLVSPAVPEHYRLPNNTPVHFMDPQSGQWLALYYEDMGARLELSEVQQYSNDGKIQLETIDSLTLSSADGTRTIIPQRDQNTSSRNNCIVVSQRCNVHCFGFVDGQYLYRTTLQLGC